MKLMRADAGIVLRSAAALVADLAGLWRTLRVAADQPAGCGRTHGSALAAAGDGGALVA